MTDFEKARDSFADDQAQVCWCAGSTCSGCEVHTRKLVKSGADFGYAFRDNQVDKLIEHTFKKKIEVGSLISRIAELEAALRLYPCSCQSGTKEVLEAHPQLKCFRCKALEKK